MIHSINSSDHTFSGGWKYDSSTDKFYWSQEIFEALELSYSVVNNGESDIRNHMVTDSLSLFESKIKEQKPFDIEIKTRNRNKEILFIRVIGTPFFNNGELIEYFGTYQSIDLVLKKLLQESEEKLKSLTNNIPGLICRRHVDEEFTVIYLSEDLVSLTGLTPEEFVKEYNSINHLIHPEDIDEVKYQINQAIEENRKYTIQYRVINNLDDVVWIEEVGHPVVNEYESDSYIDSILLDITDIKKTEFLLNEQINAAADYSKEISQQNTELERAFEEITQQNEQLSSLNSSLNEANKDLEESRNFLQKITSLSPNFIYITDLNEKSTLFLNKAAADFKEQIGNDFDFTSSPETLRELIDPSCAHDLERHLRRQKNLLEGKIAELTIQVKDQEGYYRWIYFRESIFKTDADGRPAQLLGSARDITAIKRYEQQLISSETKLRETQDIARVGRWEYDLEKDEIEFSGEAFKIFGYQDLDRPPSPEEYVKNLHEDDQSVFLENQRVLITEQKPYQMEARYRTPDASYMWVLINANAVLNEEGRVIRIIGSTQDISDIKMMERKLTRLMKTKDAVLSMVSHDLRSPLQQIQKLNSFNNTIDDDLKTTERIDTACTRALTIINELLEIASLENDKTDIVKQETDLCLFVKDIVHEYKEESESKNIALTADLQYQRLHCNINRDKFRRVVVNIIENALKFTHSGGKIEIDIAVKRDYITVSVTDSGIGIPEDALPIIFDKFSAAQRAGVNGETSIGLGLYICKYIMDLHNGDIRVESILNQGSTFYIEIPRYE